MNNKKKLTKKQQHEHYISYLLKKHFREGFSPFFKTSYYTCKDCKTMFDNSDEAIQHYFNSHHKKNVAKRTTNNSNAKGRYAESKKVK